MSDRDEAMRQAERKGAREALTRLAERRRRAGDAFDAAYCEGFRDREYPAPRVRAVVRDGDVEWRLYRDEWKPFVGDTIPYQGEDPTRAAVADMFWAQQRADAEGIVSAEDAGGLADSERSPGRQSDPASGKVKCERCGR